MIGFVTAIVRNYPSAVAAFWRTLFGFGDF